MNTHINNTAARADARPHQPRKPTSEDWPTSENWLSDQLHKVFDALAQEPLPPELLALAEQLGAHEKARDSRKARGS